VAVISIYRSISRHSYRLPISGFCVAILTGIILALYFLLAPRPSFAFVIPGVWINGATWDFIVNHRGPEPTYHVEVLLTDLVKREQVLKAKKSLSPADIDSYTAKLNFPEIDAGGRTGVFATQFLWTPPTPEHEKYDISITARDRRVSQELKIERLDTKWLYATEVRDIDTGQVLFKCADSGFPSLGSSEKPCWPEIGKASN